jgi:hypothetical protein
MEMEKLKKQVSDVDTRLKKLKREASRVKSDSAPKLSERIRVAELTALFLLFISLRIRGEALSTSTLHYWALNPALFVDSFIKPFFHLLTTTERRQTTKCVLCGALKWMSTRWTAALRRVSGRKCSENASTQFYVHHIIVL